MVAEQPPEMAHSNRHRIQRHYVRSGLLMYLRSRSFLDDLVMVAVDCLTDNYHFDHVPDNYPVRDCPKLYFDTGTH